MLAAAPGRFSTATGWPRPSASFAPSSRHSTSLGPPGGEGAMNLIGRLGYCAAAAKGTASAKSATRARRRFMALESTRGILIAHAKSGQSDRGAGRSLRRSLLEGRDLARGDRALLELPARGRRRALARADRDRLVRAGLSGRR